MKRREFVASTALGSLGLAALGLDAGPASAAAAPAPAPAASAGAGMPAAAPGAATARQIVIAGGGFGTAFIRYMAALTGKERPRFCYLPTAAADRPDSILRWYQSCAPLDLTPFVQESFVSSYRHTSTFEEVLLSMDGIVVSGGNTLNQQAIWKAQGIDQVLREAWDRGIVLGGASAGSLCWFEEGNTDSRPRELSTLQCLGFLAGSHAPHYDAEEQRRPTYHQMILSARLKPGWACDNDAGIHFVDNEVRQVIATRAGARVYHVSAVDGRIVERALEPELIA
jgi:dipeptidase E